MLHFRIAWLGPPAPRALVFICIYLVFFISVISFSFQGPSRSLTKFSLCNPRILFVKQAGLKPTEVCVPLSSESGINCVLPQAPQESLFLKKVRYASVTFWGCQFWSLRGQEGQWLFFVVLRHDTLSQDCLESVWFRLALNWAILLPQPPEC